MNKELRLDLETQGNLLETTWAEIENCKGGATNGGGGNHSRWFAFTVA
jgi:hypothetical protein